MQKELIIQSIEKIPNDLMEKACNFKMNIEGGCWLEMDYNKKIYKKYEKDIICNRIYAWDKEIKFDVNGVEVLMIIKD